jgi:hypothetical protein
VRYSNFHSGLSLAHDRNFWVENDSSTSHNSTATERARNCNYSISVVNMFYSLVKLDGITSHDLAHH